MKPPTLFRKGKKKNKCKRELKISPLSFLLYSAAVVVTTAAVVAATAVIAAVTVTAEDIAAVTAEHE